MTEPTPAPEDFISLRDRIEQLESKYKELRLATMEWGKDVETLQIRSDRHLQRIEALEANAKHPSLKEQALEELEQLSGDAYSMGMGFDAPAIRRALEQLDG